MTVNEKIERRRQLADITTRVRRASRAVALLDRNDPLLLVLLDFRSMYWSELRERLCPASPGISPVERNLLFWRSYAEALEARAAALKVIKTLEAFRKLREEQPSEEAQRPT